MHRNKNVPIIISPHYLCKAPIFRVEVAMKTKSRSSRICKSYTLFSFVAICLKSIELHFSHAYNLQIISKYALLKYFLIFLRSFIYAKKKKKFHDYSILCKYEVLEGEIKKVGYFISNFCRQT